MLEKNLEKLLLGYSYEDLVKSFFVLNLWLPNVSSPIKSQYLYVALEAICDKLPNENKITEFQHFKIFVEELLKVTPSFPMMEDYLPEDDWGEIKYFLNKKFYKMFYGGDLSNPYDFCYSFEIVHQGFEEFYLDKLGRSPIREFEFCLDIQDRIINGISIESQVKQDIELGNFELPSEAFWKSAINFLDSFEPNSEFGTDLIKEYTKDLDIEKTNELPDDGEFLNRAHDGKNCFYFFLKKSEKYFPVLPRKYFAVLFDKWGRILSDNYTLITQEVKHYEIKIGVELYHFIKQRTKEENLFFISSAIQTDLKPHKTVFTTAFISRDKLIVVHVLPPPTPGNTQQAILDSLAPELKEAQDLLATHPTRLGLHGESRMVQFESSKNDKKTLEPLIITVIPHITTDFGMIAQSNDLVGEVIGLDQFLGIIDEIEDLDELSDFFDYEEGMRGSFTLSPMSSALDRFGSFKDSNSVLIAGADSPDMVVIDPHWGTSFRYRSLVEFWKIFPEESFFGHPRSWLIDEKSNNENVLILRSRSFFGYVYICLLGNTLFFINCPAHALTLEQRTITDSLMGSLADAMVLYKEIIQKFSFAKTGQKLHALFFPLSLIKADSDFKHLTHLDPPKEKPWIMDIARLRHNDYGIRVVFDDDRILEVIRDAKDRSIQIELLIDVLTEIDSMFNDQGFEEIIGQLRPEKTKKNRFRMFASRKQVSFPQGVRYLQPEARELKLADKKIAELGKANGIVPGKYEDKEAKEKLDTLRDALISHVDYEVKKFDLEKALPILILNIDSLTAEHERKKQQVENSLDQEVDYERGEHLSEDKQNFLHNHKNNRYLLEKFVQLQPTGEKDLTQSELKQLLALVDRLLLLYAVSDFLHYGIYPAKIEIERDFLVSINYGADIGKMQTEWVQEQTQINLGVIGKQSDRLSNPSDIEAYLNELDEAFKKDLGFSLKDMVNVHHILSLWTGYNEGVTEKTSYTASMKEIEEACVKSIKGYDPATTEKILNFLTLDPTKILLVEDDTKTAPDLPVWEHRKRITRYSIKPLIKIKDKYYWGAHSVERSGIIWAGITGVNKLPADIKAPTVEAVLARFHKVDEDALVEKIKEIVTRFSSEVEKEVDPFKLKLHTDDIGDIDVFALLRSKNIILNIESKIIDQAFCNKDLQRIYRHIYGRTTSNGSFAKGYLQKVQDRANYLETNGKMLAERYWGSLTEKPTVINIFVTQVSHWWTKNPPAKTDVNFVEVQLLEDFIKTY